MCASTWLENVPQYNFCGTTCQCKYERCRYKSEAVANTLLDTLILGDQLSEFTPARSAPNKLGTSWAFLLIECIDLEAKTK